MSEFGCVPFYYPNIPEKFTSQMGLKPNESIFCSFEKLLKMSKHIDKFDAMGNHSHIGGVGGELLI